MTSVSRSDQNDEAREDTVRGVSDGERAGVGRAPRGAANPATGARSTDEPGDGPVTSAPKRPAVRGAAKTGAAKPRATTKRTSAAAARSAQAAATAAVDAAPAEPAESSDAQDASGAGATEASPRPAAKTPRARTTTARSSRAKAAEQVAEPAAEPAEPAGPAVPAAGSAAESTEPAVPPAEPAAVAEPASTADTPTASKRTPASRNASKSATTARGQAARTSRSTAAKGAASTAAARTRAAESTAKKRQTTPRAAAAVTTETTAAARAPKPEPASARAEGDYLVDELPLPGDEQLPAAGVAAAAAAAAAAATAAPSAKVAEPVVAEPEPEPELVAPEPEPEPEPELTAREAEPAVPASEPAAVAAPAEPEPAAAAEASTSPEASISTEPSTRDEDTDAPADLAVAVVPAPAKKAAARKKRTLRVARTAPGADVPAVLQVDGLVKRFGPNTAVDHISLEVRAGSFYGVVGPNGAGKTTTLSMITGLLRPDEGRVHIHGIDVWADPKAAKRATGVLPDRLRLFDRLTGGQLLDYSGTLRGLDARTVRERAADLANAFGLEDALDRLVADYSAGMTKKIALACAMIHSPRLLVLDEPFESVDPVSAANLTEILERYVAGGGTVVLSSHGMDLIERVCDSAAIVVGGKVLAHGTLDEVRQGETLEDRFVELAGGRKAAEGMEWLHSFSD